MLQKYVKGGKMKKILHPTSRPWDEKILVPLLTTRIVANNFYDTEVILPDRKR